MSEYTLSPAEHAILELGRDPYDWQIDGLESIGMQEFGGPPTSIAAANGSGKTSDLVAVAVSWFLRKYPLGWVIITSGSWNQLRNQLWPALTALKASNPGWRVRRGNECTVTTPEGRAAGIGGAIGFSTKEPKRAEGWHPKLPRDPITKIPRDPVFIIVDEAKGVPDEIFGAFQRCTTMYRLWVSSPGEPAGRFFESIDGKTAGRYYHRKVRSDECPHIDPKKREMDKEELGEDSPLYRSMHLAEFTSLDNRVILTPEALTRAFLIQAHADPRGEQVGFSDFAAGGDEDTISTRFGNVVRLHDAWRDTDTVQSRRRHIAAYNILGIPAGCVWGDADGMGNVILKDMREESFHALEFHGGLPALDPKNYANLISQVWIEGCRLIERGMIHIGPRSEFTDALFEQLTTRRMEWDHKGRLRVESKEDMKKRGVKSPDRADSYLGAIICGPHLTGTLTPDKVRQVATGVSAFGVPHVDLDVEQDRDEDDDRGFWR